MRIVIVGAGAVGSYLAERLSTEGQDVVVVEDDPSVAAELQDRLDVLVISGNGASPTVLAEAGAGRADLLIAVSNSDGANVLACHTAAELGVGRTVARVEDPDMREALDGLGVDVVIDPSETASRELVTLVQRSGVSELIEFADGRLVMVGATVPSASPLIGSSLAALRARRSQWEWVVTAIVRHGMTIVAHGNTQVEPGDHVLLMVRSDDVDRATDLLGVSRTSIDRAIVLGSTRLAELTIARLLEAGFDVVGIDQDEGRCRGLAERHPRLLALCDDPTDPDTLKNLDVSPGDAVLSLTGWDEVNILGSLIAKALGASTTLARFNRISYVGLLEGVGIDGAVSSRLAAAAAILRFVRRGRIHAVATFKDTDAEAIELEVDPGSPAVGKRVRDLEIPTGAIIGGVVRNGSTVVPRGDTGIEVGDVVIFFALPSAIPQVERIFAGP